MTGESKRDRGNQMSPAAEAPALIIKNSAFIKCVSLAIIARCYSLLYSLDGGTRTAWVVNRMQLFNYGKPP